MTTLALIAIDSLDGGPSVIKKTEKAVCLEIGGFSFWFPKSQITAIIWTGATWNIVIPVWLVKDKCLFFTYYNKGCTCIEDIEEGLRYERIDSLSWDEL